MFSVSNLILSVILFNYFLSASNLSSSWIPCASSFKSPLIVGLKFSASQWHTKARIRDKKDTWTQGLCPWEKTSSSETFAINYQVFTTVHVSFGLLCPFWNSLGLCIYAWLNFIRMLSNAFMTSGCPPQLRQYFKAMEQLNITK